MRYPFKGKIGFDNSTYVREEVNALKERVERFGKLYLEVGGKLMHDEHAARVLPGYVSDAKMQVLSQLKKDLEFVVVISAKDLEMGKRSSVGFSYRELALRMADDLERKGFVVDRFVINAFRGEPAAKRFAGFLEKRGKEVYLRPFIPGYPENLDLIASDKGFGAEPFIRTKAKIVVVVAPGPGSGKMSVALTMLYQDAVKGRGAGYAKIETFPVWNLPLDSPINLAYEAATADLGDYNVVDPYEKKFGRIAVNYNRDVEAFKVLERIVQELLPEHHPMRACRSPTAMGINEIKKGITDLELCESAARAEINRRYFWFLEGARRGLYAESVVERAKKVMEKARVGFEEREVVEKARRMKARGVAFFFDGKVLTAKAKPEVSALAVLLAKAVGAKVGKKWVEIGKRMKALSGKGLMAEGALALLCSHRKDLPDLSGVDAHANFLVEEEEKAWLKALGVILTCE